MPAQSEYIPHTYTWYGGQIGYDVHWENVSEHFKTLDEATMHAIRVKGSVWKVTRVLLPFTAWFLERHELIDTFPSFPTSRR